MNQETDEAALPAGWYYAKHGRREGPLSEDEIEHAIRMGRVDPDTSVWQPGMKAWLALGDSPLAAVVDRSQPPPLPGAIGDNTLIRCLAVAPVIGAVVEWLFALAQTQGDLQEALIVFSDDTYWWITVALSIVLALLDRHRLKRSGVDVSRLRRWLPFLLVPGYLYMRARVLKKSQIHLVVWIFSFAAVLAGQFLFADHFARSDRQARQEMAPVSSLAMLQPAPELAPALAPARPGTMPPDQLADPTDTKVETYGDIRIESTDDQHLVKRGGKVLATFEGLFITEAEKWDGVESSFQLFLLGSGGTACPAMFFLVETRPAGATDVSDEFGTCSDRVRVWQAENVQFIEMMDAQGGKATFAYLNGKLTRDGQAF